MSECICLFGSKVFVIIINTNNNKKRLEHCVLLELLVVFLDTSVLFCFGKKILNHQLLFTSEKCHCCYWQLSVEMK